jgi:CspA family cold shock protein
MGKVSPLACRAGCTSKNLTLTSMCSRGYSSAKVVPNRQRGATGIQDAGPAQRCCGENWIAGFGGDGSLSKSSQRAHHMPTGTVKWFNPEKGFGFIRPDECGSDIFFCIDDVQAAELSGLGQGLKVTYQIARTRNDEAAINLKLTELHETPRPNFTVRFHYF